MKRDEWKSLARTLAAHESYGEYLARLDAKRANQRAERLAAVSLPVEEQP